MPPLMLLLYADVAITLSCRCRLSLFRYYFDATTFFCRYEPMASFDAADDFRRRHAHAMPLRRYTPPLPLFFAIAVCHITCCCRYAVAILMAYVK